MTDLLICGDKTSLIEDGVVKTVYDMTMSTSQMFEKRRKSIGNKRNDITEELREVIVRAFGEGIR